MHALAYHAYVLYIYAYVHICKEASVTALIIIVLLNMITRASIGENIFDHYETIKGCK